MSDQTEPRICSLISCGQAPGPVPVSNIVEHRRKLFANKAQWSGTDYMGRRLFCCDSCKPKMEKLKLEWQAL